MSKGFRLTLCFNLTSESDDEIKNYVEEVWRHATRLSDANKRLAELIEQNAPPAARAPLADIERDEVQWTFNETREIGRKFARYLNLRKV